jgi:hypothetical protein
MKFKRRDLCVYTGEDFCGLNNGELVEVLGMDDDGVNMIVFYGEDGLLIPRGVLPRELTRIDHISQKLDLNPFL